VQLQRTCYPRTCQPCKCHSCKYHLQVSRTPSALYPLQSIYVLAKFSGAQADLREKLMSPACKLRILVAFPTPVPSARPLPPFPDPCVQYRHTHTLSHTPTNSIQAHRPLQQRPQTARSLPSRCHSDSVTRPSTWRGHAYGRHMLAFNDTVDGIPTCSTLAL